MAVKQSKTFSFSPFWLMRLTHSPSQPSLVDTSVKEGRHIRSERDWWEHHCSSVIVDTRKQSLVYLVYFFLRKIGKGEEEGMKEEDRKKRSRGEGEQRKRKGGRDRHHLSGFQHCHDFPLNWDDQERKNLCPENACVCMVVKSNPKKNWFSIIFLVFSHFCLFSFPPCFLFSFPIFLLSQKREEMWAPTALYFIACDYHWNGNVPWPETNPN